MSSSFSQNLFLPFSLPLTSLSLSSGSIRAPWTWRPRVVASMASRASLLVSLASASSTPATGALPEPLRLVATGAVAPSPTNPLPRLALLQALVGGYECSPPSSWVGCDGWACYDLSCIVPPWAAPALLVIARAR
ncbi:hypothetical protein D1007_45833 [Hordeum vulgare]|nr:hypothetical protein D1007_45833 [Hordeum vulgare]